MPIEENELDEIVEPLVATRVLRFGEKDGMPYYYKNSCIPIFS